MKDERGEGELLVRLQRLEDHQKIVDLNSRYCLATDDRDFDAIAQLYSPKSVFDAPYGRVQGPEEIVKYLRGRLAVYGPTIHTTHAHLITFHEPGRASGVVSAHMEMSFDGQQSGAAAMRYLDDYVQEDGGWRFLGRVLRFYYIVPWEDISISLTDPLRVRPPGGKLAAADLPDGLETWKVSRR